MNAAHAMVLAAGRGERMRPLTDRRPKPLLAVQGQALLDWHVRALASGGFDKLVVNTAWLGEQIAPHLAPLAAELGVQLHCSHEGQDFGRALETAGGIYRALPQLAEVFWVVAGDVFMPDFQFTRAALERFAASPQLAHLWLVANPAHNPGGDFGLSPHGLALNLPAGHADRRWTFSTLALYKRAFFSRPDSPAPPGNPQGVACALAPLLRAAMDRGEVSAQVHAGAWTDVGTPERLAQLSGTATAQPLPADFLAGRQDAPPPERDWR